MADKFKDGSELLDVFILETNQLLEELEEILLRTEKNGGFSKDDVEEIFRIMHTIKGSAAMMKYANIASVAHAVEDLFDIFRKNSVEASPEVFDVAFSALDYIKAAVGGIESGSDDGGDKEELEEQIRNLIKSCQTGESKPAEPEKLKEKSGFVPTLKKIDEGKAAGYHAKIFFEDGCMMENMYAFSIVVSLQEHCSQLFYRPENIDRDNSAAEYIAKNGFDIFFATDEEEGKIKELLESAIMVKSVALERVNAFEFEEKAEAAQAAADDKKADVKKQAPRSSKAVQVSYINVSTDKIDKLLDLVEEMVIAESMVSKSAEEDELGLNDFNKSSRQLRKLLIELENTVLSMRMIPVSLVFGKLNRIVRDMSRKLGKEVELTIKGEETEVDKNVINNLYDPMIHLVRNAMDHGIETVEERIAKGKNPRGRIVISAENNGSDVVISVADDGTGLSREKIIKKAKELGIASDDIDQLEDGEVYKYILHPGFSTKSVVTEYSGRGVGMDVVRANIEELGGSIDVRSEPGKGMAVIMKIPLTLSMLYAMKITVGNLVFAIPTFSILEFFKASGKDIVRDTDGNEMIMYRGDCYPIVRLHKYYDLLTEVTELTDGIMVMVSEQGKSLCLFADGLLGEQHIVVKPLPVYLKKFQIKDKGIGGCTILGDGSISFVLDIKRLIGSVI